MWFEQQLTGTMGARAGFVYKTEDDLIATFQPGRPPSAFTVPYAFNDNGVDGRAGTADDRTLTFYGMPNAARRSIPDHRDADERRPVLALQDGRSVDEQASQQPMVGRRPASPTR